MMVVMMIMMMMMKLADADGDKNRRRRRRQRRHQRRRRRRCCNPPGGGRLLPTALSKPNRLAQALARDALPGPKGRTLLELLRHPTPRWDVRLKCTFPI